MRRFGRSLVLASIPAAILAAAMIGRFGTEGSWQANAGGAFVGAAIGLAICGIIINLFGEED